MERSYLIRYGLNAQVGRFDVEPGSMFRRGSTVVVRSHRGIELGEVLIETSKGSDPEQNEATGPYILRLAGQEDLERAKCAEATRLSHFEACLRVFQDGIWPIEVIDVEPLLDDRRVVIHYLGPHRLDVAGVLAAFRSSCDLDIMLQPAGIDLGEDEADTEAAEEANDAGCGSHGSCGTGCGTGGGCATSSGSGGCGDCGVKKLLGARR